MTKVTSLSRQLIKAEKLDEYVENSYILKELAEYVRDNIEKLLEGKTE